MRFFVLMTCTVLTLHAHSLTQLLEAAHQNDLVKAYEYQSLSAKESRDALKASYYPKIDLGASGNWVDEKGSIDVGETYVAYAKASVVLFDGFARENALDEYAAQIKRTHADTKAFTKALSLEVTRLYFELLTLKGDIAAQEQSAKRLEEELKRQHRFLEARIVTQEEVLRIEAARSNAAYRIEELNYQSDAAKARLKTLTGLEVGALESNTLRLPARMQERELDRIVSMRHQSSALGFKAKQRVAIYYPAIIAEDSYSFYGYENYSEVFPIERVEQQNKLSLSLQMRLFDFFAASGQQEAITVQQLALERQIAYEAKQAKADLQLAQRAIARSNALLHAAKESLAASTKTFEVIEKKYHSKIVDYVKYLDALYQKRDAQSQYNRAFNAQQLAYANYLYQSGVDIKEYVQ